MKLVMKTLQQSQMKKETVANQKEVVEWSKVKEVI